MKAVFLDRDGVINRRPREHHYIKSWKEFVFLPGVKEAIKLLNEHNILVIVITNQAGINKGLLTRRQLQQIHNYMQKELIRAGAHIDALYYCPHRPDEECDCRKPKTGMLRQAAEEYKIDFRDSWMIGDSEEDVQAGRRAGCKPYLLKPGEGLLQAVRNILRKIVY